MRWTGRLYRCYTRPKWRVKGKDKDREGRREGEREGEEGLKRGRGREGADPHHIICYRSSKVRLGVRLHHHQHRYTRRYDRCECPIQAPSGGHLRPRGRARRAPRVVGTTRRRSRRPCGGRAVWTPTGPPSTASGPLPLPPLPPPLPPLPPPHPEAQRGLAFQVDGCSVMWAPRFKP